MPTRRLFSSLLALACLAPLTSAVADERSEAAAADLLHRKLKNEAPETATLLSSVQGKDVVVVAGAMDHVEQVLTSAQIPHTVIQPAEVADYPLRSNMIVMVDCPGEMSDAGVAHLQRFVRAGGLLYTTDWALKTLVEKAFPHTIAASTHLTADEPVPVVIDRQDDNLMSRMLLRKGTQPQWWLEGGSFPIEVLDPTRVEVLAHSDAMKDRYGSGAVVVRFHWEDGQVIHVVSHFYRQVATQGPAIAAKEGLREMEGLTERDRQEFARAQGDTKLADLESSYAFQRMTANLVAGKQAQNADLDKAYNQTVRAGAQLRSDATALAPPVAAAAPGRAMKVLKRKGDQVQVRDDQGNEGWLPAEALIAR
jgi:hypothetical protein